MELNVSIASTQDPYDSPAVIPTHLLIDALHSLKSSQVVGFKPFYDESWGQDRPYILLDHNSAFTMVRFTVTVLPAKFWECVGTWNHDYPVSKHFPVWYMATSQPSILFHDANGSPLLYTEAPKSTDIFLTKQHSIFTVLWRHAKPFPQDIYILIICSIPRNLFIFAIKVDILKKSSSTYTIVTFPFIPRNLGKVFSM